MLIKIIAYVWNRIFCNIINVFTVTFDQLNLSLPKKSIFLRKNGFTDFFSDDLFYAELIKIDMLPLFYSFVENQNKISPLWQHCVQ